jgi:hypothetical protein
VRLPLLLAARVLEVCMRRVDGLVVSGLPPRPVPAGPQTAGPQTAGPEAGSDAGEEAGR